MGSPTPPSQFFRARAYDHNNQQLWPPTSPDANCVGGGLRAVIWNEDTYPLIGWVPSRGYQPTFLGLGGSYATLLTLFPDQGDPESYFWCTQGVEAMFEDPVSSAARFDKHMNAFARNMLMRTHYSDFQTNPVSVVEHYYPY